jgi:hypothetical protein
VPTSRAQPPGRLPDPACESAPGLVSRIWDRATQHMGQLRRGLPAVLEDAENQLTGFGRQLFHDLYEELAQLEEKIEAADRKIQLAFQDHEDCQRIGYCPH